MKNALLALLLLTGVLVSCDTDPKSPEVELRRKWKYLYRVGGLSGVDTVFAKHDTIALTTYEYTDQVTVPALNQFRLLYNLDYKSEDSTDVVNQSINYDIIMVLSVFDNKKMWSVRTQDFGLSNNGRLIMFDANGNLILRDNAINSYTHYYTKNF